MRDKLIFLLISHLIVYKNKYMSSLPDDLTKIKLKQTLVDIKNTDKAGWTESWTETKKKNWASFPHPTRMALIGPPSAGKSFMMKHLIMHQRPMFRELYIIHGDGDHTTEFDDVDPSMIMTEFPPIAFWDGKVKTLVIIDDVEFSSLSKEQFARMNKLFRYGSSHKNITVYVSHQSFFDLPILVRKLCNVFILWKPRSVMELKTMSNRVGFSAKALDHIFENVCSDYRDSLCIDHHYKSPAVLRKNLWEKIDLPKELSMFCPPKIKL
jgi:hypothetical protein